MAVEELNIKPMLQSAGNSQNTASAAWDTFSTLLEYNCKRERAHFVEGDPAGTAKECTSCGVATDKSLWVREHSCPACGFEMDRDANAVVRLRLTGSKIACDFATALNMLSRGFDDLGVVHSEGTPVETALPLFTASDRSDGVNGKRVRQTASGGLSDTSDTVIETGSPCLMEAASAAE